MKYGWKNVLKGAIASLIGIVAPETGWKILEPALEDAARRLKQRK